MYIGFCLTKKTINNNNNKKIKGMSEKHIVVQGATVKCKFSITPKTNILKVKTQRTLGTDFTAQLSANRQNVGQSVMIGQ